MKSHFNLGMAFFMKIISQNPLLKRLKYLLLQQIKNNNTNYL